MHSQEGNCIVHHLFGKEVVAKINEMYCDAFLTAHFEVPGEMFSLAMEAKRRGMGVVGSTQNILDFIQERVRQALDRNVDDHLQFVLGTETGMVTAIVAAVRKKLNTAKSQQKSKVSVEIVFPVSPESITRMPNSSLAEAGDFSKIPIIPGVASGEGCSLHGGCASCPYMKVSHIEFYIHVYLKSQQLVLVIWKHLMKSYVLSALLCMLLKNPNIFSSTKISGNNGAYIFV